MIKNLNKINKIKLNKDLIKNLGGLINEASNFEKLKDWEDSYGDNIINDQAELKETILFWFLQEMGNHKDDIPNIIGDHENIIKQFDFVKYFNGFKILKKDLPKKDLISGVEWGQRYVIVVKNDTIIGAIDGNFDGTISRIEVDKYFRKQGLGSELMRNIGNKIETRKNSSDLSLIGLKTYLKSIGTNMKEVWEYANRNDIKGDKKIENEKKQNLFEKYKVKNIDNEIVISNYFYDDYAKELDEELIKNNKNNITIINLSNQFSLEEIVIPSIIREKLIDGLIYQQGQKFINGDYIRKYAPDSAIKLDDLFINKNNLTSNNFNENEKKLSKILDEALREAEIRRENAGYLPIN